MKDTTSNPGFDSIPDHYNDGGREVIDKIRDTLGDPAFANYCEGNRLKYHFRAGKKGGTEEAEQNDKDKSVWYEHMMNHVRHGHDDPRSYRGSFVSYEFNAGTDQLITIRHYQQAAYWNAKKKGFHDGWSTREEMLALVPEKLMLITCEVAECMEAYRVPGHDIAETRYTPIYPSNGYLDNEVSRAESDYKLKPDGFPAELADIVIRCFDLAGMVGIDLESVIQQKMNYNSTRPYMHGKNC